MSRLLEVSIFRATNASIFLTVKHGKPINEIVNEGKPLLRRARKKEKMGPRNASAIDRRNAFLIRTLFRLYLVAIHS
jgi:hypothetical protein